MFGICGDTDYGPDRLHNPGSCHTLVRSGVLVCLPPHMLQGHSLTCLRRPLNPASVAKDVAHAVSLVNPSHLAIHPSKLAAVQSAFKQLNLDESQRPTVFTVIERHADLKLVGKNFVFVEVEALILDSFRTISLGPRNMKACRLMTFKASRRKM